MLSPKDEYLVLQAFIRKDKEIERLREEVARERCFKESYKESLEKLMEVKHERRTNPNAAS